MQEEGKGERAMQLHQNLWLVRAAIAFRLQLTRVCVYVSSSTISDSLYLTTFFLLLSFFEKDLEADASEAYNRWFEKRETFLDNALTCTGEKRQKLRGGVKKKKRYSKNKAECTAAGDCFSSRMSWHASTIISFPLALNFRKFY